MTTVKTAATNLIQWVKTNPFLTILCSLLVVMLAVFVATMFSKKPLLDFPLSRHNREKQDSDVSGNRHGWYFVGSASRHSQ